MYVCMLYVCMYVCMYIYIYTPWKNKDDAGSGFDVTMESFDGAETCELVVCYMLAELQHSIRQGNRPLPRRWPRHIQRVTERD